VVSHVGKGATITRLSRGDFVGEESLAAIPGLRLTSAVAISTCSALKIDREEMIHVMHQEHEFSDLFLKFLLERSMRTQADLVDQLFNSSEKRLARILLLMAEFGKPGERETSIPAITQETLAEMIGTTRPRVSFFMNRFRALGLISYNGRPGSQGAAQCGPARSVTRTQHGETTSYCRMRVFSTGQSVAFEYERNQTTSSSAGPLSVPEISNHRSPTTRSLTRP
jgi:hypothetical protein